MELFYSGEELTSFFLSVFLSPTLAVKHIQSGIREARGRSGRADLNIEQWIGVKGDEL